MTTAPNPQPLAALLASHPADAALAVEHLCAAGPGGLTPGDLAAVTARGVEIATALCGAALAYRGWCDSDGTVYVVRNVERAAIARMGAASWLAGRCPRTDSHRFFDLSNARLHEIAADAMRSAVEEQARKLAYRVRSQADAAVPMSADAYRYVLTSMVAYDVPLDVDAEVAAVWGAGAPAKGEQR